jgi:PEP-CTERM motif
MTFQVNRRSGVGLLALLLLATFPRGLHAEDIILPGFDLYDPLAGTQIFLDGFGLIPFIGVPLGSFDFGSGSVATGNADTIFRRNAVIDDTTGNPNDLTTSVDLLAMQMKTDGQFDLGAGLDTYYLTVTAGPASTGTMEFAFGGPHDCSAAHGTFSYTAVTWNFDLWTGSPGGTFVFSDTMALDSTSYPWLHCPPAGAVLIPGVNVGFFPIGQFSLRNDNGTVILLSTAVPEPSVMLLFGTATVGLVARRYGRRRQRPS